jgi:hypothetical protein
MALNIDDDLRRLLESYAEPCVGDCEHSQCPLLRELHALRIKATLERAGQTVQSIIDREREGEQVGDLMSMRLRDSRAPVAAPVNDAEISLREYVLGFCPEKGRGNAILSIDGELTLLGKHLVRGLVARLAFAAGRFPDPRHWQSVKNPPPLRHHQQRIDRAQSSTRDSRSHQQQLVAPQRKSSTPT